MDEQNTQLYPFDAKETQLPQACKLDVVREGPYKNKCQGYEELHFPLNVNTPHVVGRKDLPFLTKQDSLKVSRQHFEIQCALGKNGEAVYTISDKSVNGTLLVRNAVRTVLTKETVSLEDNDRIYILFSAENMSDVTFGWRFINLFKPKSVLHEDDLATQRYHTTPDKKPSTTLSSPQNGIKSQRSTAADDASISSPSKKLSDSNEDTIKRRKTNGSFKETSQEIQRSEEKSTSDTNQNNNTHQHNGNNHKNNNSSNNNNNNNVNGHIHKVATDDNNINPNVNYLKHVTSQQEADVLTRLFKDIGLSRHPFLNGLRYGFIGYHYDITEDPNKVKLLQFCFTYGGQYVHSLDKDVDIIIIHRDYFKNPSAHGGHMLRFRCNLAVRFVLQSDYLEHCCTKKELSPITPKHEVLPAQSGGYILLDEQLLPYHEDIMGNILTLINQRTHRWILALREESVTKIATMKQAHIPNIRKIAETAAGHVEKSDVELLSDRDKPTTQDFLGTPPLLSRTLELQLMNWRRFRHFIILTDNKELIAAASHEDILAVNLEGLQKFFHLLDDQEKKMSEKKSL